MGHERAWAPTLCLCPQFARRIRRARAVQPSTASCRLSTSGAGIGTTLRLPLGGWRIRFLRAPVSRKICVLLMLLVLGVREGRRGSRDWLVNFPGALLFSDRLLICCGLGNKRPITICPQCLWGVDCQAPINLQARAIQAHDVNGLTFIPTAHALLLYSCNHL